MFGGSACFMFLWLVASLKQGVIYFIKQALPPNFSAGSVSTFDQSYPSLFKPIQTYQTNPNILEATWNQLQQFSKTLVKYHSLKTGENITATIQLEWVCEKHFLKEVVWDDIFYFYPDIWCSDCAKIAESKLLWKRAQIKHKEQNFT